eukprot:scaffold1343_cov217-Pinguiococcus_pyrenoidosus.AAC.5
MPICRCQASEFPLRHRGSRNHLKGVPQGRARAESRSSRTTVLRLLRRRGRPPGPSRSAVPRPLRGPARLQRRRTWRTWRTGRTWMMWRIWRMWRHSPARQR